MRKIGEIEGESNAKVLSDYLYVEGIENEVEEDSGDQWSVWVLAEEHLDKATRLFQYYRSHPSDPKFERIVREAAERRAEEERSEKSYRRKVHSREETLRRTTVNTLMPLTLALLGITIAVYVLQQLKGEMGVRSLVISQFLPVGSAWDRLMGLTEIRQGQVWRLFTPIFLHYGILHIIFNMLWLIDLGSAIERKEGAATFLLFILVVAAISNVSQFVISGPRFGGMSGVVYGLLGYIWIRGKCDPFSGYHLNPPVVYMMLAWLVICMLGWIPRVANTAHLSGLLVGMAWGYLSAYTRK